MNLSECGLWSAEPNPNYDGKSINSAVRHVPLSPEKRNLEMKRIAPSIAEIKSLRTQDLPAFPWEQAHVAYAQGSPVLIEALDLHESNMSHPLRAYCLLTGNRQYTNATWDRYLNREVAAIFGSGGEWVRYFYLPQKD